MRYTKEDLPAAGWAEYRKLGTTRMTPIAGPCTVMAQEGPYNLPAGWTGYLALDGGGWPYPIDSAVHADNYEQARAGRMRTKPEVVAMRDQLERYALHHYGLGDQGLAVVAALRWVTDPTASDGELLSIAEGDGVVTRPPAVAIHEV